MFYSMIRSLAFSRGGMHFGNDVMGNIPYSTERERDI